MTPFSSMRRIPGLYLVTPPRIDPTAFAPILALALDAVPVAALQIRLKSDDEDLWRRAAEIFVPIAQAHGVAAIMTDRCELAAETRCDGIQLTPRSGITVTQARAGIGKDALVGVVCEDDLSAAASAAAQQADYVAFGMLAAGPAIIPPTPARPETVRAWAQKASLPALVMGRIRPEGCRIMIEAGASYIAGIGGVWDHPDGPAAGAREMADAIAQAAMPQN